jgi:hypothetical protein
MIRSRGQSGFVSSLIKARKNEYFATNLITALFSLAGLIKAGDKALQTLAEFANARPVNFGIALRA